MNRTFFHNSMLLPCKAIAGTAGTTREFYWSLTPGHRRALFGHATPPGDLTLGKCGDRSHFPRHSLGARTHGEGTCLIDALSRYGHGERRPDPGSGRQAAEDWAKNHQAMSGPRPPRRDAEELQERRVEDGHESYGNNRRGKVCAEMSPVYKETYTKTNCEAASPLQVGYAPLLVTLFATEAAVADEIAQTCRSSATETAGLRAP